MKISDEQLESFIKSDSINMQNTIQNQFNKSLKDNLKSIKSPEERFDFVTKRMDNQTELLQNLQYENIKLNAQIEVMNKTIDSNNEELHKLQSANSDLKAVNQTLKDNNKHYWLYTTLISVGCAVLGIVLGHYF